MKLERIPTPALVLDRAAFEKNADAMSALLAGSTLALRPHYKSHKCSAIAKWQIAHGAKGMTCAKLSEARDLADCGIGDILIANQITDPRKIRELADLAGDCRLTVCVDDEANAKALSVAAQAAGTTIHCLVEYEIGMNRCGITDPEAVVRLARTIAALPGLEFDGVQAYAGHLSHTVSETERAEKTAENSAKLRKLLAMLADALQRDRRVLTPEEKKQRERSVLITRSVFMTSLVVLVIALAGTVFLPLFPAGMCITGRQSGLKKQLQPR